MPRHDFKETGTLQRWFLGGIRLCILNWFVLCSTLNCYGCTGNDKGNASKNRKKTIRQNQQVTFQ
eukprot:5859192-Amphidinium_carterae.1